MVNEHRKQTWSVISLTSLSQPPHPFLPHWCNTPPAGSKLVQWHSYGNDMVPDVTPCAHVHTSIHQFQSCKRISYTFMLIITKPLHKMHDKLDIHHTSIYLISQFLSHLCLWKICPFKMEYSIYLALSL